MFGDRNIHSVVAYLDYDPAADDVIPVWTAPQACTIVSANAVSVNGLAADGTNYYSLALRNIGAAGTATTAIAAAVGGTAGWTALVPTAFTINTDNNNIAAGDVVSVVYDENGTGTFTAVAVQLNYVIGTGS